MRLSAQRFAVAALSAYYNDSEIVKTLSFDHLSQTFQNEEGHQLFKYYRSSKIQVPSKRYLSQLMRLWYLSHRHPRSLGRAFGVRTHKVWK